MTCKTQTKLLMKHFVRCMALLLPCLCVGLLSDGQLPALTEKINIRQQQTTAAQVVRELDRQSSYTFSYAQSQLEKIKIVSFTYENITLGRALDNLRTLANLEYNIEALTIAIKVIAKAGTSSDDKTKPGKIAGVVKNERNELIPGASVVVEQNNNGTTTSVTGDYVLKLPPGNYTLLVSFIGHEPRRITDVEVKEDEMTDLSVVLKTSDSKQLQTVVVTSGARKEGVRSLLMTQKNNASMTNGISAEQIRATPDNNTAQVLKRVSGITVQSEKFVTIRGVSDRYNNVLINGASLPSTEPNRRNFSFDIVPSQLVDNIVVNKTATPDLPSEFTGGIVQINTKDVPAENFLSITVGTGFNTAGANKNISSYKRDDKALSGVVDKNRKWFGDGGVLDPVQYYGYRAANDTTAIRQIGSRLPNRWQIHQYPYKPVQNYQLAGGLNKRFNNNSLGFVAAVTYLNEQFYEEGDARILNQYEFSSKRNRYNTTIGALLNAAFKTPQHRISIKNLYNKRYSNQFDEREGDYAAATWYARRTGEVTLQSRLTQTRLEGEHKIFKNALKADWFGDYINFQRIQPDTRFITGREINGKPEGKYQYNFSDILLILGGLHSSLLKENKKNAGLNLSLPFNVFREKQLFKAGYAWSERRADFDAANFRILQESNYGQTMVGYPYYEITSQEAFRKGQLVYYPTSTRAVGSLGDRYTGKQRLSAAYFMFDLKPVKQLRLIGGFRYEDNKMDLSTVFYDYNTGRPAFDDTTYIEKDWLPSVNLVWGLTEKFNIRGAFSKTLARPDFVERSPYIYYDFTELAEVIGQKALQVSRIDNYDLRFEYYPTGDEILSASLFYKDFSNPVERFYNIGNSSNSVEYRNLYKATAKGFEIDFRKSMAFINPASNWLQHLYVSGNYTHLQGAIKYLVTVSPATQKDTSYIADGKRPIQGLSPYIINGGINYQSKVWGFNIAYNRIGRRIVNGGTNAFLIQYENSRDVVDLQFSTRLMNQKLELKINVSDLLNQPFVIYSNTKYDKSTGVNTSPGPNNDPKGDGFNEALDLVNYKVKRGANFGINLTYKL